MDGGIFQRNLGAFTADEQSLLHEKSVFVAGCGGLGGFAVEFLTRSGVGKLVVCDKDVFDKSNCNRQLLATVDTIGKSKAETARERAKSINPDVSVTVIDMAMTGDNAEFLMGKADLAVDCLDNAAARKILEEACETCGIPLVLAAVDGWLGQVSTVYPGDGVAEKLYGDFSVREKASGEASSAPPSVLGFAAAAVASYQAAEAVKVLLGKPSLKNKVLLLDTLELTFDVLEL